MSEISRRKTDHLELTASGSAEFRRKTTLLDQVQLVHQSLPERGLDDIDLSTDLCGRRLSAPLVITGMTGGTSEAGSINRDLARAAQELGIAFGVGSQRAMLLHPELADSFRVRDVAPDVFLIGNLGVVQARELGTAGVAALAADIGADALAVHLNPAQELIQQQGDRHFDGAVQTLRSLAAELELPVIAKETGCGLSVQAAQAIASTGVRTVDVSGAGGTSWVAVEALRVPPDSDAAAIGQELWDWGTPTAVSTVACARAGLQVIASGGLRTGLDVARSLALGASSGGLAAPVLRAHRAGGYEAVIALLRRVIQSLQTITLLCGCARSAELTSAPRHLGAELRSWLVDLGLG